MPKPPRRLNPHQITDKTQLAQLLDEYLATLENSPMQVHPKALAWELQLPENLLARLRNLPQNPADTPEITAEDYHILFSNIMFRFPTVKMWQAANGEIFFEM